MVVFWAVGSASAQDPLSVRQTVEVELSMTPAAPGQGTSEPLQEGSDVKLRFSVRDKLSGEPLEGRYPSGWMELNAAGKDAPNVACKQRVQRILNADLFARPEIDLNTYYVLVLNYEASITVVDPIFGYGNTKLLAITPLHGVGQDWALSADQKLLFVSMPEPGEVAAIDTSNWRVVKNIKAGPGAGRVALQPDGHFLWVALESSVVALDTSKLEVVGQVSTGAGPHAMAITPDSHHAFIVNGGAGSASIVDTGALTARNVSTGPEPASVAFSAKSQLAYITDKQSGVITVLNTAGSKVAEIKADRGIGPLGFARDGRYGFVLNPGLKRIHILDSSVNRIVQTAETGKEPDQVTFSSKVAFIRQKGSETVLMVPLDVAGQENKAIPIAEFPAGQHALDRFSLPSSADSIVRVPGEDAVLVANPADKAIYYYKEGMAAPMGYFSNYAREPRAVAVIDRTLRQTKPGVYETTTRLEKPGRYTAVFLLDSPQAVKCWDFTVEKDPVRSRTAVGQVDVIAISSVTSAKAGVPLSLRFRLEDTAKRPISGVADVRILAYRAPGVWKTRVAARALSDGVYEVTFQPPQPGSYLLHVEAPSIGLALYQNRLASISVE
jgi:DNA-binding beta-propeller fold protein YncE